MLYIFLQSDALAAEATQKSVPIIEILLTQTGWFFLIPLLLMSFIAVYIFFERFVKIQKANDIDNDFMTQIQTYMLDGDIKAAENLCAESDTPISHMVRKGIRRIGKPLRSIEVAIENEGRIELLKLEKNLAYLATIAGAAPMVGFLGTVTGMINAFYQISNAGSSVEPGVLAGGIYQALLTTAIGLTIGIIAFVGYNILVSMVEKVVYKMEYTTIQFVDFLQTPAK
ncbi:MAG: MotA/TolQ/ExbB proton channel family protein [Chitinophagales bacterium]